jgi:hypothetical protein
LISRTRSVDSVTTPEQVHVFEEPAMSVNPSPASGRLVKRAALLVLIGSLALTSAACGKKPGAGNGGGGDDGSGGIGGAATAAPSGDAAGGSGGNGTSPNTGTNGNGNGGNNNNGGNGTRTSAPSGPSIVYFRLKQKPVCPSGTGADYVEGKDAIVEWKLSGVDKAELAVDGPGLYDSYTGTTGQQVLGFGCGDWQPGQTATHHYTLTITDDNGKKISKNLTATAKVG